jgi:hypothetical protein
LSRPVVFFMSSRTIIVAGVAFVRSRDAAHAGGVSID